VLKSIKSRIAVVALATALVSNVQAADITGAGATFIYPLLSKWSADYNNATGTKVNYQSIGSGGGIAQIKAKTVDFGSSDAPLKPEELAKYGLAQFPSAIGGVVPIVNLVGVPAGAMKFDGPLMADIYLGKVTKWNDPRIVALNGGVQLPDSKITVVHRSDGSGTTYVWVDYLTKESPEWAQKVGRGTSVNWPVGLGGRGNEGVTATVRQTPGAIGYVELGYAIINKMAVGAVRNKSGNWITPTLESVTAAAQGAMADMGAETDFRVSITDPAGAQAYPIASFTWVLARKQYPDAAKARELVKFLWWALTDGQAKAASLGYAPLPKEMLPWIEARLKTITSGGRPVWRGPTATRS
jgi:phosphate transport system substrate-binding protein